MFAKRTVAMNTPGSGRLAKSMLAAVLLAVTAVSGPVLAADWMTEAPITVRTALPKGKAIKVYVSPDKKQKLIIFDEGNHGDFFYYSYYHFNGKRYALIQTYVASGIMPSVTWTRDHLSFQAQTPTGPQEVQILQVEYYPAKSQVRSKVLRTEAVESAG